MVGVKGLVGQFLKFSGAGLVALAVDYGLFLLLSEVLGVYYLLASLVSYCVGISVNFALCMKFVFSGREGQTRGQQFLIFFVLSVVGLGLNQVFLWAFVELVGVAASASKLIAAALNSLYNYVSRKYFLDAPKAGLDE